jgi:hypothetical protein
MQGWGIRNESIDDLVYVYIAPRMIRCLANILIFKSRQKYSWVVIRPPIQMKQRLMSITDRVRVSSRVTNKFCYHYCTTLWLYKAVFGWLR